MWIDDCCLFNPLTLEIKMYTIIIQAQEAYAPVPGMIAVVLGKPPLVRYEVPSIDKAIRAVQSENERLTAANINHEVYAICYGRKPHGWKKFAGYPMLRRSYLAA
jgi:hypothetical protein